MSDLQPATSQPDSFRLKSRIEAIEKILVVIPLVLAEALLVLALFVPFVTAEVSEREETVNLFGLVGGLFGGADGEGADSADVLFGVAFVVLIVAVIAAIFILPLLGGGRQRRAAAVTLTVITVLLALGTLGAWVVMAMGTGSGNWMLEPALPLLTAGTAVAALLVFVPAYRSIWVE